MCMHCAIFAKCTFLECLACPWACAVIFLGAKYFATTLGHAQWLFGITWPQGELRSSLDPQDRQYTHAFLIIHILLFATLEVIFAKRFTVTKGDIKRKLFHLNRYMKEQSMWLKKSLANFIHMLRPWPSIFNTKPVVNIETQGSRNTIKVQPSKPWQPRKIDIWMATNI